MLEMLCPSNKTPVLLCDRGLMNGKAYMDQNALSFNEKLEWLLHEVLRVLGTCIP